ncbi:unnamed protein product [Ascophyllum nodosum]
MRGSSRAKMLIHLAASSLLVVNPLNVARLPSPTKCYSSLRGNWLRERRKPITRLPFEMKGKRDSSGRPTLDDVERLSMGQAAKKRGTGSRRVCHRLNESERKAYDLAKKKGYVVLRGTGYRKERKGSPLLNTFRQFCDAKATPCISVLTGLGPDSSDEVEIDFSPLRVSLSTLDPLIERADEVASGLEAPALALENVGGEQSSSEFTAEIAAANGLKIDNLYASSVEEQGSDHVDEDVEDEWSQDSNSGPIWTIPAIGRVYRCATRKGAKDVAEALSSVRL